MKTSRLMLREITVVYSDNHTKHVSTSCKQNARIFMLFNRLVRIFIHHCVVKFNFLPIKFTIRVILWHRIERK
jgi:hypothetical protein